MRKLKTDYENLRVAAAIVDGIPKEKFVPGLRLWWSLGRCGTTYCAGGWLAGHPAMQALGLTRPALGTPTMRDVHDQNLIHYGHRALACALEITGAEAMDLFNMRGDSLYDAQILGMSPHISDKDLFRRRVQMFLLGKGEVLENPL